MIHRLFYRKFSRIHGWDLRNVQVACRAIITQAEPLGRTAAQKSDDICVKCNAAVTPEGQNVLFVKEAQQ